MSGKKIKVVWFCTPFNWPGGGTVRHISNWAKHVDWDKFEISFVLGGSGGCEKMQDAKRYFESLGSLRVICLDDLYPFPRLLTAGLKNLLSCLRRLSPDVLHTIFVQSDIVGGLVRRWLKVPIHVSSLEGALVPWFVSSTRRRLYKAGYALVRRNIDAVIAISRSVGEDTKRNFGVENGRVHVIHSGVDLSEFQSKNGWPHSITCGPSKVGIISRLSVEKCPCLFVQAAPYVLKRHPNLEFVVAGTGPEEGKMKELARELGVFGQFRFVGWCDRVGSVFQALDVFVFLSKYGAHYEGLPWSVLEAQSVCTPTIASAVAGVPEVIRDGENGLLLHSDDARDLADKIVWMVENPERAADMARRGRKSVENHFNVKREVHDLEYLYEALFREKGPDLTLRNRIVGNCKMW